MRLCEAGHVYPSRCSGRRSPWRYDHTSSTEREDSTEPSTRLALPTDGISLLTLAESKPGTMTLLWSASTTNGKGGMVAIFASKRSHWNLRSVSSQDKCPVKNRTSPPAFALRWVNKKRGPIGFSRHMFPLLRAPQDTRRAFIPGQGLQVEVSCKALFLQPPALRRTYFLVLQVGLLQSKDIQLVVLDNPHNGNSTKLCTPRFPRTSEPAIDIQGSNRHLDGRPEADDIHFVYVSALFLLNIFSAPTSLSLTSMGTVTRSPPAEPLPDPLPPFPPRDWMVDL